MARLPRCAAAGLLHLVELRWCAEAAARMADEEFALQRQWLAAGLAAHRVSLHAYAISASRTLLLLTPESAQGPARLVQDIGRRLAVQMRRRHGHQGPLMAGRFRSVIVQPQTHLLDAMQYVEQLPLREGVGDAWSSADMHRGGAHDELVTDHSVYWSTGNTPFERESLHRARLAEGLAPALVRQFDTALAGGWPIGDAQFLDELAQQLQRRVVPRAPGRPAKLAAQ